MQCPECGSEHIRKNGHRRGKQNHLCVDCRRQFVANPQTEFGYSDEVRRQCLKLYTNGLGFRAIERVSGVHHTTVINWVKQSSSLLPDAYAPERVPKVAELDELQTFVGSKKRCDPASLHGARERAPRQTKSGFGRSSTTSVPGSSDGSSVTAVGRPLQRYGRWSVGGTAFSM